MTKSRRMKRAGHAVRTGEKRNIYNVVTGNPEGKRPFGRHGSTWENHFKIDLKQTECGDVDWTHLAQNLDQCNAYVSTALNLRVPYNSGISRLAEELLASEEGLCSVALVS
jgi:hypothetical protein